MALDRFVRFKKDRRPKRDDVERLLRNFFGEGATTSIDWEGGRFYVTLPGHLTFPFAGLTEETTNMELATQWDDRGRWIEVYVARTNVDVITRGMDEYTNALADHIAEMLARFWNGELDDGA